MRLPPCRIACTRFSIFPSLGPYFFHSPDFDSAIAQKLYQAVPANVYREFRV